MTGGESTIIDRLDGSPPVVVTGSASGMGAATYARLRAQGRRVVGIDRHDAEITVDLGVPSGRSEAAEQVAALASAQVGLAGAVTFAGVSGLGASSGATVVATNYFGTVDLLVRLRPLMARLGTASAVAVSSNAASTTPAIPGSLIDACLAGDEKEAGRLADDAGPALAYAAAKAAVARWVRREATGAAWVGAGITLNAIAPGVVDSPMTRAMRLDPKGRNILDRIPLPAGRPGRAGEIAALVVFLLGNDARFLVGSVVVADGGTDAVLRPDGWPPLRP